MLKKKSIFLSYFNLILISFFDFVAGDSKLVWVPIIGKFSHPMIGT